MREETQIVITLGYASQTHWLTVVREYIAMDPWQAPAYTEREFGEQFLMNSIKVGDVVWAEHIFKFWQHKYYKKGGTGSIPR
jgi:hypothetical protein